MVAVSRAAGAMDTALKSKVPNVLPAYNRAAGKVPLDTAPAAVAHLVFDECSQMRRSWLSEQPIEPRPQPRLNELGARLPTQVCS